MIDSPGQDRERWYGTVQRRPLARRQLAKCRREAVDAAVAPSSEPVPSRGGQVQPGHPPVRRINLTDKQALPTQLLDKGAHRVGSEPQLGGSDGHGDAGLTPDQSEQLGLCAGQWSERPVGTAVPQPTPQRPDAVEQRLGESELRLVASWCRCRRTEVGRSSTHAGRIALSQR